MRSTVGRRSASCRRSRRPRPTRTGGGGARATPGPHHAGARHAPGRPVRAALHLGRLPAGRRDSRVREECRRRARSERVLLPAADRRRPIVIPGEYLLGEGEIVANQGRRTVELTVSNTADRPIQIGSHFHFFEVNRALRFDRAQAFGMRLNVPAGTAVRFEPGDEKRVTLVELAGTRRVFGLNGLTEGGGRDQARAKLAAWERPS